jgi:hypothetical protein
MRMRSASPPAAGALGLGLAVPSTGGSFKWRGFRQRAALLDRKLRHIELRNLELRSTLRWSGTEYLEVRLRWSGTERIALEYVMGHAEQIIERKFYSALCAFAQTWLWINAFVFSEQYLCMLIYM